MNLPDNVEERVEDDGAVRVMPFGQVDDAGHNMDHRKDELFGGQLTTAAADEDCWLCQRGCCVQRHFFFADGGLMVVHGTYEA